MIFYDFEVFKYDWMVVLIDPEKDEPYRVVNDKEKLEKIYESYKEDIWVGFNSRHYDQYILKAILCGLSASECNDWMFKKNQPGWSFSNLLQKIFLINKTIFN